MPWRLMQTGRQNGTLKCIDLHGLGDRICTPDPPDLSGEKGKQSCRDLLNTWLPKRRRVLLQQNPVLFKYP
jgi:hypothetical protein